MKIIRVKSRSQLAEDFAKSIGSVEAKVEFNKLIAVEELLQFMERAGINRSELAERMGVPPSRITKMLSGDSNLTIETLVRASHAVGAELKIRFQPAKTSVEIPNATQTFISKFAEDPTPYRESKRPQGKR